MPLAVHPQWGAIGRALGRDIWAFIAASMPENPGVPINVVVRTERGERVASLDEMTAHLPGAERPGESYGTVTFPLVSAEDIDAYPMLASVDP